MEGRNAYYEVFEKCSKANNTDITDWLRWFLGCYQRAQTIMNECQRKVVNRILEAGRGNFIGGLTTRKYASITKVSRATAFRQIADLLNKKVLYQLPGKGRSVHYDLVWPLDR